MAKKLLLLRSQAEFLDNPSTSVPSTHLVTRPSTSTIPPDPGIGRPFEHPHLMPRFTTNVSSTSSSTSSSTLEVPTDFPLDLRVKYESRFDSSNVMVGTTSTATTCTFPCPSGRSITSGFGYVIDNAGTAGPSSAMNRVQDTPSDPIPQASKSDRAIASTSTGRSTVHGDGRRAERQRTRKNLHAKLFRDSDRSRRIQLDLFYEYLLEKNIFLHERLGQLLHEKSALHAQMIRHGIQPQVTESQSSEFNTDYQQM